MEGAGGSVFSPQVPELKPKCGGGAGDKYGRGGGRRGEERRRREEEGRGGEVRGEEWRQILMDLSSQSRTEGVKMAIPLMVSYINDKGVGQMDEA